MGGASDAAAFAVVRVGTGGTGAGARGLLGLVVRMFAEINASILSHRDQLRRSGQTPPALRYSRSIAAPIIAEVTIPPSSSASNDACSAAFFI